MNTVFTRGCLQSMPRSGYRNAAETPASQCAAFEAALMWSSSRSAIGQWSSVVARRGRRSRSPAAPLPVPHHFMPTSRRSLRWPPAACDELMMCKVQEKEMTTALEAAHEQRPDRRQGGLQETWLPLHARSLATDRERGTARTRAGAWNGRCT
jgi:hypothetical protein